MRRVRGPLFEGGLDLRVRPHHHRNDPETSVNAAASALERAPESCQRIHEYLRRKGGKTDEEGQYDLAMFSYPKRRVDLFKAGLVEDSGKRRDSSQGKPMIVWRAVE